jgi:hypothetical protein
MTEQPARMRACEKKTVPKARERECAKETAAAGRIGQLAHRIRAQCNCTPVPRTGVPSMSPRRCRLARMRRTAPFRCDDRLLTAGPRAGIKSDGPEDTARTSPSSVHCAAPSFCSVLPLFVSPFPFPAVPSRPVPRLCGARRSSVSPPLLLAWLLLGLSRSWCIPSTRSDVHTTWYGHMLPALLLSPLAAPLPLLRLCPHSGGGATALNPTRAAQPTSTNRQRAAARGTALSCSCRCRVAR